MYFRWLPLLLAAVTVAAAPAPRLFTAPPVTDGGKALSQTLPAGTAAPVVKLGHDAGHLYLQARIPDASRCTLEEAKVPLNEAFRADSLEFWLGRHQYTLALQGGRLQLYDYLRGRELPVTASSHGAYREGGYDYFVGVAFSELGEEPLSGRTVPFAFQVNDRNSGGEVERRLYPAAMEWDHPVSYVPVHFSTSPDAPSGPFAPPLSIRIRQFAHEPRVSCAVRRLPGFEESDFAYRLLRPDGSEFQRGKLPAGTGEQLLELPVDPAGPGLYRLEFFLCRDGAEYGPIAEPYFNPGREPLRSYRSPRRAPTDLAEFWQSRIAAMRRRPLNAKVEQIPGPAHLLTWMISLDNHRGNPMRVFVTCHREDVGKKLSGELNVYPPMRATGTQNQPRGVLTVSFCGSLQGACRLPGVDRDAELWDRAEDLENSYWLDVVLDGVRALDAAATLPVSNGRFTVTGGSRGGWYAFALGAVAPDRVALASFTSPCYSDVTMNRELGWGSAASEIHQVFRRDELLDQGRRFANFRYFDPLFLAELVRTPFIFSAGLQDNICSAIGMTAAANRIDPKFCFFVLDPEGGHGGAVDLGAFHRHFREEQR